MGMKRFGQYVTESAKTWSAADFPHIVASSQQLESSYDQKAGEHLRNKTLPKLIEYLNQYQTGDVPNPVFVGIKDIANRFADIATKYPVHIYAIIRGNRDIDTYDYNVSSTYVVPGKLKKVQAALAKEPTSATPFFKWLEPILRELAPVAAAVEDMKARVVKRQPKAPEDAQQKYVAPMMSMASGKLVVDALTKMSQAIYDDFAKAVYNFLVSQAEHLNTLDFKAQMDSRNELLSLRSIWADRNYATKTPARLKPNYKAQLVKEGKDAADDMQKAFVLKNAKKLGSIMDAKRVGLKAEPEILKAKAGVRGAFEGDMRLTFADSSTFEVRNKVVFKTNHYGTYFLQYPTTFHNVTLPDGSAMSQPSEQRMNEIFAKA
jgi:hypothetical protein